MGIASRELTDLAARTAKTTISPARSSQILPMYTPPKGSPALHAHKSLRGIRVGQTFWHGDIHSNNWCTVLWTILFINWLIFGVDKMFIFDNLIRSRKFCVNDNPNLSGMNNMSSQNS